MMCFIKENNDYDVIYNSIQMRINWYETKNVGSSRDMAIQKGSKKILKSLPKINQETKNTIDDLKRIQKSLPLSKI